MRPPVTRKREKPLGLIELIAIALGGMIGGGIFSILGISVEKVGNLTPIAIAIGGCLAFFAAYSYVKLAIYYQDEGATYSFFKKTFPQSRFAASAIGWLISFGYISTLALYAYTFSSYLSSVIPSIDGYGMQKISAGLIILIFTIINLVSVKGMGKIEDLLVYTKIIILLIISGIFIGKGDVHHILPLIEKPTSLFLILTVSSITFVAYEGFQLVIHAYQEADNPNKNVPKAIYISIFLAALIYILLSIGALFTLPKDLIIRDKEFALASGATTILGNLGLFVVIFGALLATSSAISGTLFGASRLMAVIADDGYFPSKLKKRIKGHIPPYAIIFMSVSAYIFILTGGLETILEFGSITFIVVSFLMAFSNFKIAHKTNTKRVYAFIAMTGLAMAGIIILWYQVQYDTSQIIYICFIYGLITLLSWVYAKLNAKKING